VAFCCRAPCEGATQDHPIHGEDAAQDHVAHHPPFGTGAYIAVSIVSQCAAGLKSVRFSRGSGGCG
jgi:hypothetical protein